MCRECLVYVLCGESSKLLWSVLAIVYGRFVNQIGSDLSSITVSLRSCQPRRSRWRNGRFRESRAVILELRKSPIKPQSGQVGSLM